MNSFVKIIAAFAILFTASACLSTSETISNEPTELDQLEVEIVSVKPEKDGNTVVVRDDNDKTYQAVISIPNLGPDSDFDFDHLQPGNRMTVSGEVWYLDDEPRLTVREAEAI